MATRGGRGSLRLRRKTQLRTWSKKDENPRAAEGLKPLGNIGRLMKGIYKRGVGMRAVPEFMEGLGRKESSKVAKMFSRLKRRTKRARSK